MITASVFFSCKKDEKPDPQRDAFAAFQGKYLVCDSVRTTINGTTTTQVLGKGKGWDLNFGLYGNLEVYSSPTVYKSYTFESPDKIYYWTTTYDSNKYYTVQSTSGSKIVLRDTDQTGKVFTEYFTAE
ncbi:MAG: hypothetical protein JWQ09_2356 [Segetibacter sp.]|nr:hypothetical protein [Segetibacter sp.]